jgi:hypothetical protein
MTVGDVGKTVSDQSTDLGKCGHPARRPAIRDRNGERHSGQSSGWTPPTPHTDVEAHVPDLGWRRDIAEQSDRHAVGTVDVETRDRVVLSVKSTGEDADRLEAWPPCQNCVAEASMSATTMK